VFLEAIKNTIFLHKLQQQRTLTHKTKNTIQSMTGLWFYEYINHNRMQLQNMREKKSLGMESFKILKH
jgi:hypothetical protein